MTKKGKPIFKKEKVLVVDDIPKWLKVAGDNLNYYGCPLEKIVTAENVEEAFRKYSEQYPTLIMTDINFDVKNLEDTQGLSLIKRLREDGYESPLVAMSSLRGDIEQRTKNAGADYFIDKKDFVSGMDNFVEWYSKYKK